MTTACPAEEALARMLDDRLEGPESEAVESHVASCPDCQRALERLTLEETREDRSTWLAPRPIGEGASPDRAPAAPIAPEGTQDFEPTAHGAGGPGGESGPPEPPGYRVERELGRGGMGLVYLARQVHANRMVALKMVLANRDRPEDRLRFVLEGESLARLHHPHIVQVYEVGEWRGRPFFSMEYVEGGTMAGLLAGPPMAVRDSAAMVGTIAKAVHAAHQSGIVHRDLKPANILLAGKADARGAVVPKITDFGLAKHVGVDSGLTQTGQILGTPSYMAPEQATGGVSVGVPADVYALGAILYEAMAGRPPFKGASAWETMMQVAHDPVVAPSRWRAGLPRDLEVICLKCLQKAPADRYPSADAMAEDLRRFLAGESILARPAGPARRAALWCRRHPAYAAMVSLLVASMLVGVAGVGLQWRRAEAHLGASRRRLDLAMRSISAFYTGASGDVLLKQPEMETLRAGLLRTPLEFYRGLRDELEATGIVDRPARAQLADALIQLGRLTQELGNQEEAEASFRQASEVARALVAEDPGDRAATRLLAWGRANSGKIAAISARFPEARAALGEADALFGRLGRDEPGVPDDANGRGFCRHFLGDVACDEGRFDESEGHYRDSISLRRGLVEGGAGDVRAYLDQLGGTANNLGTMFARSRRLPEAERAFRDAVDYRRRLSEMVPSSTPFRASLAASLGNLGSSCYDQHRDAEARSCHEQALAILERIVADHGAVPRYRADLAAAHYRLGTMHAAAGRRARARAEYGRAADELARLSDVDPAVAIWREDRATILMNLGDSLEEDGSRSEAAGAYARALAALDRPPAVATAEGNKARAGLLVREGARSRKAGRHDAADALFGSALAAAGGRGAGPDSRVEMANILRELAGWELCRREPGWAEHALADSRRAASLLEDLEDDESRVAKVDAVACSARALAASGRAEAALSESERAKASSGSLAKALLVAESARAEALAASGRPGEALKAAEEAEEAAIAEGAPINELPAVAIRVARAFAAAAGSPAAKGPADRAERWIVRAAEAATGEDRFLLRELEAAAFDALRDRPGFRAAALDLAFPRDPFAG